jgi:hypothetical protein
MGRGSGQQFANQRSIGRPAPGVLPNRYPIGLAPGGPWFDVAITDYGAAQLVSAEAPVELVKLLDLLPGAQPYRSAARLVAGSRTHAVTIERLPDWKRLRKGWSEAQPAYRYHDHLGVGVYIYDGLRQRWYQRALHGRGRYAAPIRPYADQVKAARKRDRLVTLIASGQYAAEQLVEEGLSPTTTRRAADTARLQTARSAHQARQRGPSPHGLLFGRR